MHTEMRRDHLRQDDMFGYLKSQETQCHFRLCAMESAVTSHQGV
jgi:hypothetical protein